VIFIVAELGEYISEDQDATGHTDGESCDVDKGITLVFLDVPDRNFQIILKHTTLLWDPGFTI